MDASSAEPRAASVPSTADGVECSIDRVEHAISVIEGRWKLLIIHHLLVAAPRRFSDLERAIPAVSQKMLIQQLRALEVDGVVRRTAYPEVPPRVEYDLTAAGAALEPALNALHDWAASEHLEATSARLGPRTA
ncbi:winged helix-turn-helix transcriptional regulator [Nocardioides sp. BP30]|uniref:winged helix-turn-helix transcriptional regulator n=1 Tax=Nocardioides sp. BP30 TaxID=3036374 RepID=UPI002468B392|nr:winged helix-turn-helix transcriptional regulator [Nocardioides sp. BP30]WGL51420.1 winged helix-turn-helix transcriptional regulator [Nocardioides sp. BP30]